MQNEPYKLVALLPMKAHSSRVPGKNFRPFAGRPLFRWILDALLEVEAIEKIVINTDARSLLRQHGMPENDRILIRDRPQEICGTTVSMNRVIEDDLEAVSSELYLMTHATNPLLHSTTISSALEYYRKKSGDGYDSLFTVNEMLGRQIATIHNLGFYLWLVREARKHILAGDYTPWKNMMVQQMDKRL